MLLARIVEASSRVAATRSRTTKVAELTQALSLAGEDEVASLATAYLSGVLPQRRTGVGYRSLSDLPGCADTETLTLTDVDAAIDAIAHQSGPGSEARRKTLLHDLFDRATAAEQSFLTALLTGQLRHGALGGLMLQAVAHACGVPESDVRRAVMLTGSTVRVAEAAMSEGALALAKIRLEVERPLRPMLAASAPDVATAMVDLDEVGVECKIDGIRLQIHVDRGNITLFTRSLEDVTARMPEIVEVARAWPLSCAVIDAEAAVMQNGRPAPFQVTAARTASRTDPDVRRAASPLTVFVFDLLHVDGRDLLELPAVERFAALARLVPAEHVVPRLHTCEVEQAQAFFDDCITAGYEGVVVKRLDTLYEAGRRGAGWIKVKPRHTLDLVVVAVE